MPRLNSCILGRLKSGSSVKRLVEPAAAAGSDGRMAGYTGAPMSAGRSVAEIVARPGSSKPVRLRAFWIVPFGVRP